MKNKAARQRTEQTFRMKAKSKIQALDRGAKANDVSDGKSC
jgi:hypothetical protein